MVIVRKRLLGTDDKVDIKLPIIPPHQCGSPPASLLSSCSLLSNKFSLSMSDVTSEYGFILTEPETLTGHMENLCSVASQII